jgi:hypothetical protein
MTGVEDTCLENTKMYQRRLRTLYYSIKEAER